MVGTSPESLLPPRFKILEAQAVQKTKTGLTMSCNETGSTSRPRGWCAQIIGLGYYIVSLTRKLTAAGRLPLAVRSLPFKFRDLEGARRLGES